MMGGIRAAVVHLDCRDLSLDEARRRAVDAIWTRAVAGGGVVLAIDHLPSLPDSVAALLKAILRHARDWRVPTWVCDASGLTCAFVDAVGAARVIRVLESGIPRAS